MAQTNAISKEEDRWCRVGRALNTLNRCIQEYLPIQLLAIFNSLPRITDQSSTFSNCLCDKNGEPLKFLPENQADGIKLNFRALPHFEKTANTMRKKHEENCSVVSNSKQKCQICEHLKSKNMPIPILSEHEFAHLFLQEFYKEQACGIGDLDASANLLILSKPGCFSNAIQNQAVKVRGEVRNKWAHAITPDWTEEKLDKAFKEMEALAELLPNKTDVLKELCDRRKETATQWYLEKCKQNQVHMLAILHRSQELPAVSVDDMLAEQVSKIKVISKPIGNMGAVPKETILDTWTEGNDITHSSGILKEDVEQYGAIVIEGLFNEDQMEKNTQSMKSYFKNLKLTRKHATKCEIVEVKKDITNSLHLVIAAQLAEDDTVTMAYATHRLVFQKATGEGQTLGEIEENLTLTKTRFLQKLEEGGYFEKGNF